MKLILNGIGQYLASLVIMNLIVLVMLAGIFGVALLSAELLRVWGL